VKAHTLSHTFIVAGMFLKGARAQYHRSPRSSVVVVRCPSAISSSLQSAPRASRVQIPASSHAFPILQVSRWANGIVYGRPLSE
jgi:hypothetical protein